MGGDAVTVSMEESKMDDFFQEVPTHHKRQRRRKRQRRNVNGFKMLESWKKTHKKKASTTLFFSLAFCNSAKMKRNKSKWLETQMPFWMVNFYTQIFFEEAQMVKYLKRPTVQI